MFTFCITLLISLFIVFGSNGYSIEAENIPTPVYTPFPTPSEDTSPFPDSLFCNKVEAGLGSTWRGITVGLSTLEELKVVMNDLSENYTFYDRGEEVVFSIFLRREALTKQIPSTLVACVHNNIVIAMEVNIPHESSLFFLEDWIIEFGIPDAVTWDDFPGSRVVFWFEEGIAARVFILEPDYGAIWSVVYFPYQIINGFEERWPYNRTRNSPAQHN